MKIGILTYYGVHNHGAVLQANALKKVLVEKGNECGFLKFERSYSNISKTQAYKYKIGIGSISFYAKYLLEKGPQNIWYNFQKKKTLNEFRKSNIPMLGEYEDFDGDLVIIGSDEVFSLDIGVNPQLYGNNLISKCVASYAGCFGPTTIEDVHAQKQEKMISEGLNGMIGVSVRDENSKKIIKEIAGIEAKLVCDPVILYGYKKEMNEYRPKTKNYILIYSYDKNLNDANEYKPIMDFAKKNNLKVLSVGYHHKWCKSVNASPIELLGWIKNANLVVTDTFHGSVMSIICNTPMVVKLRDNQNKLKNLLSEYGLLDRTVSSFDEIESVSLKEIDFNNVNEAIENRREKSMMFLEDVLRKVNQR